MGALNTSAYRRLHSLMKGTALVRLLPSIAFLVVLCSAATLSASVGLQMVKSEHVVVWYEGQIDTAQAQSIADDASKEWTNGADPSKITTLELRIAREFGSSCVVFDNFRLEAVTPQLSKIFAEFGKKLINDAFPDDSVTVLAADGVGHELELK